MLTVELLRNNAGDSRRRFKGVPRPEKRCTAPFRLPELPSSIPRSKRPHR